MKHGVDLDKVIHSYKGTMNIDENEILPGDIDNSPFMDAVRAEDKRIDDEIYEICEGIAEVVGFGRHYFIDRKNVADALRKQIPKKVTHEATLYRCCTCPTCKNVVDEFTEFMGNRCRVTPTHCKYCGQALDWGETND